MFKIKFAQSESVLMALNSNNFYMEIPNCQFDCISRLPANNCEKAFPISETPSMQNAIQHNDIQQRFEDRNSLIQYSDIISRRK